MFDFCEKMDKTRALNVNPIVLAFLGDAVYSLYVRKKLVFSSDFKANEMNTHTRDMVNASAQAAFARRILPVLTEEEAAVFKRARNAKKNTHAKNASLSDYHASTGLEAVLGFLYLIGDFERLNYLLNEGVYES